MVMGSIPKWEEMQENTPTSRKIELYNISKKFYAWSISTVALSVSLSKGLEKSQKDSLPGNQCLKVMDNIDNKKLSVRPEAS